MPLDDATLAALKAEHGEVWTMELAGEAVAFRAPKPAEYDDCVGKVAADAAKSPSAMKQLAFDVLVHPSAGDFRALVARRPGIALKLANEAMRIANDTATENAKKA